MERTEQQQLELITEMINTARKAYNDNSFIFLLWGWAICLACLTEFVLIKVGNDHSGIVWLIAVPGAFIAQMIFLVQRKKKEQVKSHLDRVMKYVWTAAGVGMFVVLGAAAKLQMATYPMLMVMYGIGTFISGGIMKLKPMQAGGICCWVLAIITLYVSFEYQLLLLSLSLILAYIIPGYILKNRYKKNVQ